MDHISHILSAYWEFNGIILEHFGILLEVLGIWGHFEAFLIVFEKQKVCSQVDRKAVVRTYECSQKVRQRRK